MSNPLIKGFAYLVGAGPGDPGLLTVKGARLLEQADVVIYDALANPALLQHCPSATAIYVGKRAAAHSMPQEEINALLVREALAGKRVVRLKGGDPFVFGRGYEELDHAASFSIPATVIPGISSAIAVPGLQQIPVTHRGLSESFWVITGTTTNGKISADIYTASQTNATIVVLMGVHKLAEIAQIFKNQGKNRLPVAVIQSGSTENEKVAIGTIETIVEQVDEKKISSPALIVIGEVVSLHPSFQSIKEFYDIVAEG